LHFGVDCNRESMIPLLLEHKADVNIQLKVMRGLRVNAWGRLGLRLRAMVFGDDV